jgi:hypothetical protein
VTPAGGPTTNLDEQQPRAVIHCEF